MFFAILAQYYACSSIISFYHRESNIERKNQLTELLAPGFLNDFLNLAKVGPIKRKIMLCDSI